jgi:hypothetical protein
MSSPADACDLLPDCKTLSGVSVYNQRNKNPIFGEFWWESFINIELSAGDP